jgi:hypothetical protein
MDQGMNQAIHRCRPERLAAIGSVFDKRKHVLPLQLSNGEIPAFSMVFWHSKEAHIELDMDREHQDNNDIILNHWVSRAITQGLTQLTDKEVSEFLQLVRTATFAFFKVKRNGSSHYYFMRLSNNLNTGRRSC